jgi:hypothetical protein
MNFCYILYISILGTMSIDSPIDVSGSTEDAYLDLLIADPQDRSQLANIGTIFLPAMTVHGTVYAELSFSFSFSSFLLFLFFFFFSFSFF